MQRLAPAVFGIGHGVPADVVFPSGHEWLAPAMMLLPNCGAIIAAILGCLGLLFPSAVGRVLRVKPDGPSGISEMRATYGGFFLCLGIGCLIAQSVPVFTVVGAAWCAAAVARAASCAIDGSRTAHNLAGIGIEAGIGLAHLAPQIGPAVEKLFRDFFPA
jgi:hypothetical protein